MNFINHYIKKKFKNTNIKYINLNSIASLNQKVKKYIIKYNFYNAHYIWYEINNEYMKTLKLFRL